MNLWWIIALVLAGIIAVLMLLLLAVVIRMSTLASRSGSFPAWLLHPTTRKWVRGIAIYGSSHLAWRRVWGLSARPNVILERQNIDVVQVPRAWEGSQLLILRLEVPGVTYSVAVSPGNAAGLISWIDSSAPSGQIRS